MNAFPLRPAWSPLTVVLTLAGFIVWWPLGFVVIAYVLWGDRIKPEHVAAVKDKFRTAAPRGFSGGFSPTGNAAFDAYRESVLRRLEDERRALVEEERAFADFLKSLREARDREEFDRFMAERNRARS